MAGAAWGDNAWGDLGWGGVTTYEESVTEYLTPATAWGVGTWGSGVWGGTVPIFETQEATVNFGASVTETAAITDAQ